MFFRDVFYGSGPSAKTIPEVENKEVEFIKFQSSIFYKKSSVHFTN